MQIAQLAMDDTVKLMISMLSILNPVGVIPIFLAMTESFSEAKVKAIATSCSITVVVTLLLSLFAGKKLLSIFSISVDSFTIGGGFLVFTMAMEMIKAKRPSTKMNSDEVESLEAKEIGIVPLAIPLISGPGSISTAIIYSSRMDSTFHWVGAIVTFILLGILIKVIFNYSRAIGKKLGTLGLNVMTRIMGLILLSVSIEMVSSGLRGLFPILESFY